MLFKMRRALLLSSASLLPLSIFIFICCWRGGALLYFLSACLLVVSFFKIS
jgi:hypothetical protein